MAGLDVVVDVRRRLRPGFVVGPHAAVGGQPERGVVAEALGDELGGRRMDREMADQTRSSRSRSTCSSSEVRRSRSAVASAASGGSPSSPSSRTRSHSQGRRSRVMRNSMRRARSSRTRSQIAASRRLSQSLASTRGKAGSTSSDHSRSRSAAVGGSGSRHATVGVLPVLQGLLDQVVGVLDRPGVSGQALDQPGPRPGGEPPQRRRTSP